MLASALKLDRKQGIQEMNGGSRKATSCTSTADLKFPCQKCKIILMQYTIQFDAIIVWELCRLGHAVIRVYSNETKQ